MKKKKTITKSEFNDNRLRVPFPDPAIRERVKQMALENGNIPEGTQAYMLICFALKQHDAVIDGKKK